MSFDGKLLYIYSADKGYIELPMTYCFKESYTVVPNRRQDLNSTRTATGVLKRNVVEHRPSTIEFKTRPMNNTEMSKLMNKIYENFTVAKERKVKLKYYAPDLNDYQTGEFYLADVEFPIVKVDEKNATILYNSTTIDFVEY